MIRDTEYYHHNLTTTTTNDKAVTVVFAIAFDFLFSNNNNNKWCIEYKNDVKVRSDYFGSHFSHSNCFDMNFGREFVEKCAHLSIPFTWTDDLFDDCLRKIFCQLRLVAYFWSIQHTFTTRLLSRDIFFFVDHWRDYFSIFIACISSSSVELCCFVSFCFVTIDMFHLCSGNFNKNYTASL